MMRLGIWFGLVVAGVVATARGEAGEPDVTPPVITVIGGPQVLECGIDLTYTDPGAMALDAVDGEVPVSLDLSHIKLGMWGGYFVYYTATDLSGNTSRAARSVNVVDTVPPYVELYGEYEVLLPVGTYYDDPGGFALDQCEGPLELTRLSDIDYSVLESQTLVYSATDLFGNTSWVYRVIVPDFAEGPCFETGDFNRDGLLDHLFDECNKPYWAYDAFGETCARYGDGISWYADSEAEEYTATFFPRTPEDVSIKVTIPRLWRQRSGFLAVLHSCSLSDLLSRQAGNLAIAPDEEMAGNAWMFIALCVADKDGNLVPLTTEQLAVAPLRIEVAGLTQSTNFAGYFAVADGAVERDEDGLAVVRVSLDSAWHQMDSDYQDGRLTGTLTHLGVIGALEGVLPAKLNLLPDPSEDLVFESARVSAAPASKTILISNSGGTPLTATVSRGGSGEFAVTAGTFVLHPGESQEITVTFSATRVGEAVGQLVVFTEQDGPQVYTLRGVGLPWDDSRKGFLGCGVAHDASGVAGDLLVLFAACGVVASRRWVVRH